MKHSLLALMLFPIISFAQHGVGTCWNGTETAVPKLNVTGSQTGTVGNNMVVLPNGTVWMFYGEFVSGQNRIIHSGSNTNGSTWTSPSPGVLSTTSTSTIMGITGAVGASSDTSGNTYVSWVSSSDNAILCSKYDYSTSTWQAAVTVSPLNLTVGVYNFQFITVDRKGRPHIFWCDIVAGQAIEVYHSYSTNGGASFSSKQMISSNDGQDSQFPHVDLIGYSGDSIIVSWRDEISITNWDIMYARSTDGGSSWLSPQGLATTSINENDMMLVVGKDGIYYIAYAEYYTGICGSASPGCARMMYRYSTNYGITWSSAVQISEANVKCDLPKEAYDYACDYVYFIWKDKRDYVSLTDKRSDIVVRKISSSGTLMDTSQFITDQGTAEVGFANAICGTDGILRVSYDYDFANPPYTYYYKQSLCSSCLTTGISDNLISQNSFFVYPNPFGTQTTLHTDVQLANATLTLDNYLGQTVAQVKNISGQTVTFSRDNLPSGLYFGRLTQDNQIIGTIKLVIADN